MRNSPYRYDNHGTDINPADIHSIYRKPNIQEMDITTPNFTLRVTKMSYKNDKITYSPGYFALSAEP